MNDPINEGTVVVVEVFKTNVKKTEVATMLIEKLLFYFPGSRVNFDLSDCDNILRVEGRSISPEKIIQLVSAEGYELDVLL